MSATAGLAPLVRVVARRDRLLVPAWAALFGVVAASSAAATASLYTTPDAQVRAAETVNASPALVALYGRIFDVASLEALAFFKLVVFGAALVGLLGALVVVRHSRADEEVGRTELVVSTAVGRHVPLMAAMAAGATASALAGLATTLGAWLGGVGAADATALGLGWGTTGLVFTGVGALAAQLASTARAARGLAVVILVVCYLVRAVADVGGWAWLRWLTPLGWAEEVRPFAGNRLWVASAMVALAVALVPITAVLARRRDLGEGVIPVRPGPAEGTLGSSLGLAWRMNRAALLGWAVGLALLGALLGSLVTRLDGLLDSPQAREMVQRLGGSSVLEDAFVSTELGFIAVFVTGFGLSVLARSHAEEAAGRAELLVSAGTSRRAWLGGHLAVAALGTTALMLVAGTSLGVVHLTQTGVASNLLDDVVAALVRLPAIWCIVAAAAAVYAVAARLAAMSWAVLVAAFVVGELGDLMGLPDWARSASPYTHVPQAPAMPVTAGPLLWMTGAALLLVVVGVTLFTRRDLTRD